MKELVSEPPGRGIPGLPADKIRVTQDGSVWSYTQSWKRWRRLTPTNRRGCLTVQLVISGHPKTFTVASLICRAFHGPRPLGCIAYHFPDRDTLNCHADNLRWAPKGTEHLGRDFPGKQGPYFERGHKAAVGSANGNALLTEHDVQDLRALRKSGWTIQELADEFEISIRNTRSIANHTSWKHVPDLEGEARS